MIILPDFNQQFEHENSFYLTCDNTRFYKPIVQYELYKKIAEIPGTFAEFGIFKGTSFIRFLTYRHMLEGGKERPFLGFDVFDKFPDANLPNDKEMLEKYLKAAGNQSISREQLIDVLSRKNLLQNVTLIEGDILHTLPDYIKRNPHERFAMIHLDVDLYSPSKVVLELCWDRLVPGGILVLDDYGVWEGETKAVDEFFMDKDFRFYKMPFSNNPVYIIK